MANDQTNARRVMVDCQIRTSDVTRLELLDAFLTVPREDFVPAGKISLAYLDEELALGGGRYLLAPAPLAKLLQAAFIGKGDKVLEIGCASGYSTALISSMCKTVVAVEASADLAGMAGKILKNMGFSNALVVNAPHGEGYAPNAPYDVIFVSGSAGEYPDKLAAQLGEGGRMVLVEGTGNAATARLYVKEGGQISGRKLFNCAIPPLPGLEAKPQFVF